MPRNPGTGQYSKPIPDAVPNTTIASAPYNSNVDDVVVDLNSPRPVVAGGTGASNAHDALIALHGEEAQQGPVTNFDSFPFVSGSFFCNSGATGAPNSNPFNGICYVHSNSDYVTLEARDVTAPLNKYVRNKIGGTWGSWVLGDDASKVSKAGDTMTGPLTLATPASYIVLNKTASGANGSDIWSQNGGVARWLIRMADDISSDFNLFRFNDAGAVQTPAALTVLRANGNTTLSGDLTVSSTTTPANGIIFFGNTGTKYLFYNNSSGFNLSATLGIGAVPGSAPGLGNTNTGVDINFSGLINISRSGPAAIFSNINADGANVYLCRSGNPVGNISVTTTATAYNTSSSADLKEDLKAFDAGNIIDATNVYDFRWKATGERSYGILAQQAVEVYPAAVFHDEKDDWWGINYAGYVPILLQELKALRARVAQLEAGTVSKPA